MTQAEYKEWITQPVTVYYLSWLNKQHDKLIEKITWSQNWDDFINTRASIKAIDNQIKILNEGGF